MPLIKRPQGVLAFCCCFFTTPNFEFPNSHVTCTKDGYGGTFRFRPLWIPHGATVFPAAFHFPLKIGKKQKKEGAPPLSAPQVLTAINSNAGSALPATATPPDSRAYVSVGVTVDQSMKNAFASFGFSCSLFCCGK